MIAAWTTVLILGSAAGVLSAPHIQNYREDPFVSETPCNNETSVTTDVYDQRQNGTENYRINVNGVVVLLAPAETLLAAANLPNLEEELSSSKPPKGTTEKPATLETSEAADTETGSPILCEKGRCVLPPNSNNKQRGKLKMMNNIIHLFRNLKEESPQA